MDLRLLQMRINCYLVKYALLIRIAGCIVKDNLILTIFLSLRYPYIARTMRVVVLGDVRSRVAIVWDGNLFCLVHSVQ